MPTPTPGELERLVDRLVRNPMDILDLVVVGVRGSSWANVSRADVYFWLQTLGHAEEREAGRLPSRVELARASGIAAIAVIMTAAALIPPFTPLALAKASVALIAGGFSFGDSGRLNRRYLEVRERLNAIGDAKLALRRFARRMGLT